MPDSLVELIPQARRNRNLYAANEEATKQGLVLPLLAQLGWNRDNISEVTPEYSVGNGRVDYCLRRGDEALVFVEVKRAGEPLDPHEEQLLRYAFDRGVTLAVLTDGMRWWLYLPTQPGSWEKRRFFTVDLEGQAPERVAAHLRQFLEKSAILSGAALRAAQELHADRTIGDLIKKAIPVAWRELCEQPHPGLIELLSEKVEGRCGHRPDPDVLDEFIARIATGYGGRDEPPRPKRHEKKPFEQHAARNTVPPGQPPEGHWTSQKAISFTFLGQDHPVRKVQGHPARFGLHLAREEPVPILEPREPTSDQARQSAVHARARSSDYSRGYWAQRQLSQRHLC